MNFNDRIDGRIAQLSTAERRVARYFRNNREEVLISSAFSLGAQTATSDATVVRTAKALGYSGLDELRRDLVIHVRHDLSVVGRMTHTLEKLGNDLKNAFDLTLDIHIQSLGNLRRDISPELYSAAIQRILAATQAFIFGIGPSSAIARYFEVQLNRIGISATALTDTGLVLADSMNRMRHGSLLILFAYGHVYREVSALLDHAAKLKIATMLITDSLGEPLRKKVDIILPVARGGTELLSMHTATLGLVEALLAGLAMKTPTTTIASLKALNVLREKLAGQPVNLEISEKKRRVRRPVLMPRSDAQNIEQ